MVARIQVARLPWVLLGCVSVWLLAVFALLAANPIPAPLPSCAQNEEDVRNDPGQQEVPEPDSELADDDEEVCGLRAE